MAASADEEAGLSFEPLWFPKNGTHGKWCTRTREERFEFIRLPNASVYFTVSRNLYDPGEPEVRNLVVKFLHF